MKGKTYTTKELVKHIKSYAADRYEQGGWDVIVEAWSDEEIAEQLGNARTKDGAQRKFWPLVLIWSEKQSDAAVHAADAEGEIEAPAIDLAEFVNDYVQLTATRGRKLHKEIVDALKERGVKATQKEVAYYV